MLRLVIHGGLVKINGKAAIQDQLDAALYGRLKRNTFRLKPGAGGTDPGAGELGEEVVGSGGFVGHVISFFYILNTPNPRSSCGAFSTIDKASPNTCRVSSGEMTPSSHSLAEE